MDFFTPRVPSARLVWPFLTWVSGPFWNLPSKVFFLVLFFNFFLMIFLDPEYTGQGRLFTKSFAPFV